MASWPTEVQTFLRGQAPRWGGRLARLSAFQAVSLFYVCLPAALFVAGWLRWHLALPILLLMGAAALRACDPPPPAGSKTQAAPGRRATVLLVLLAGALTAASGIGGYTFQFADYGKHNAVLLELIDVPWPLGFPAADGAAAAGTPVYYWGYYLPAAAVGKLFGWPAAYHFTFVWAALGMTLIGLWLQRLLGARSPWWLAPFACFGGLDLIGYLLVFVPSRGVDPVAALTGFSQWQAGRGWLDLWMMEFAQQEGRAWLHGAVFFMGSLLTRLSIGPHHLLPAVVAVLMMLDDAIRARHAGRTALLWSAVPINSAMAALGMAPFVLLTMAACRMRGALTAANLAVAPVLLGVMGLHFLSNVRDVPSGALLAGGAAAPLLGAACLFFLLEFGLPAWAAARGPHSVPLPVWWPATAIGLMLLGPFLVFGPTSELYINATMPAQVVFVVWLLMRLHAMLAAGDRRRAGVLIAILAIGCMPGAGVAARAIAYGASAAPPDSAGVRYAHELLPPELQDKVVGDPQFFFWRHLARPVHAAKRAEPAVVAAWRFTDTPQQRAPWRALAPARQTDRGLVLQVPARQLVLELPDCRYAASEIGTVAIDYALAGAAAGNCRVVALWDVERPGWGEAGWWRAFNLFPVHGSISDNPFWRGVVTKLRIELDIPPDAGPVEMTVTGIRFLRR